MEDKGFEIQDEGEESSVSSEVVKEVVQDQSHMTRLTELDSMMGDEKAVALNLDEETESQALDADEDKVTIEFLLML